MTITSEENAISNVNVVRNYDLAKKAIAIINEEYKKELKTGEVADRLAVSERHLQRILKAISGKTFRQSLNDVRIIKSMDLLKNEALSIAEIGFEVGYQSYTHFNRVFQLYTSGISLKVFREQHRQSELPKPT